MRDIHFDIKKFDIETITNDSVIVMIGKRRTGKSFLIKDLLYHHRDIPIGTVISGTESANNFFSEIIPRFFIHEDYSAEIINNVYRRQKLIKSKHQTDQSIDPRAFLILDDLMFDDSWIRDTNVKRLFFNGRHYHLMFMVTMQYPLGIPPNLRTNVDYVFIFRENIVKNRRRIYENYAGMFPTFEMFCECMDACTEQHECMVIKVNSLSNKLENQVFWYKASEHEKFKIGSSEFWDMLDKKDKSFDPSTLRKNKSNVRLNISKTT